MAVALVTTVSPPRPRSIRLFLTAQEIIQQIKTLPPEEQAEVVNFVANELQMKATDGKTFQEASKQMFERHAELMRKLSR